MKTVSIGDRRYRLVAIEGESVWLAHAEGDEDGRRFGLECDGATELEALDRLGRWLTWQAEHAAALQTLQGAERAYHRAVAGSAFAKRVDGQTSFDLQKASLDAVDAARLTLDEVRARKPD